LLFRGKVLLEVSGFRGSRWAWSGLARTFRDGQPFSLTSNGTRNAKLCANKHGENHL